MRDPSETIEKHETRLANLKLLRLLNNHEGWLLVRGYVDLAIRGKMARLAQKECAAQETTELRAEIHALQSFLSWAEPREKDIDEAESKLKHLRETADRRDTKIGPSTRE